jgi:predicted dinucleotide-binding enzyme
MTVGIIGAGKIGQAVAKQTLRAGYSVVISNSRGPASLESVINALGPRARAGSVMQAADQGMVVIAVPWSGLQEAISSLPAWNGRIVVDATNAVILPEFRVPDLGGRTSSEIVAAHEQ